MLIALTSSVSAQEFKPDPDWRFENYNSQNHFTNAPVSQMAIDNEGYIWTSSSILRRFDGYHTVEFNAFEHPGGSLRNNYAGVMGDAAGGVWITARGICSYNYRSGRFDYVKMDAAHDFKDPEAFSAMGNYLWFVTEFGLARLDIRTRKVGFTSLTHVFDALCTGLINDSILMVSSRERVYFYNIKTNTYTSRRLVYKNALLKIFCIRRTKNAVFLGTNNGLFQFYGPDDIRPLCPETRDAGIDDMVVLPQDKAQKYLLLASEGRGLLVYNTSLGKIEFRYLHDDANPLSISCNGISHFFIDKNERLWFSTDIGVSMLDLSGRGLRMRYLNTGSVYQMGINKIARDKYDSSRVWMCSYNQGMISVNWPNKQLEKIYNHDARARRLYDFVQVAKNKWLLATQKAIMEWNPQAGILSQTKLPLSDSMALICNIRRLIQTDDTTCYVTSNHGLFRYNIVNHVIKWIAHNQNEKSSTEAFKYILLDGYRDKDSLWIGSRNGFFRYNLKNGDIKVYRGPGNGPDYFFFDIANAAPDQLIGAAGEGITIFNKLTGKYVLEHKLSNMFRVGCSSVIAIKNTVWIGTDEGILTYDLVTHQSGEADLAFPGRDVYPSSSFVRIGNDVVFGFSGGFAYFTPQTNDHLIPSAPVIERIYVNNRPVLSDYNARHLTFDHAENSFNINFTSFLYAEPDNIRFRYRLSNADHGWNYAGEQRSANYTQLPPGSYTFYVQTGNKTGFWNKTMASFSFVVNPPYWETWWFRLLAMIAIAYVLYRLYRYKIEHLQAIEKIRANIASDFHDDLGSTLSSISIFSQVAVQKAESDLNTTKTMVSDIGTRARAMIHSMNDMVWMIKPENDNLYRLIERMEEFGYPVAEAKDTRLIFDADKNLDGIKVEMLQRKNLFLVFKEAFNNAIKYSDSKIIMVRFTLKHKKTLTMEITDEGCGFDLESKSRGNGLGNMQKRAAEMKGKLKITTAPGRGVTISIICEIT